MSFPDTGVSFHKLILYVSCKVTQVHVHELSL